MAHLLALVCPSSFQAEGLFCLIHVSAGEFEEVGSLKPLSFEILGDAGSLVGRRSRPLCRWLVL